MKTGLFFLYSILLFLGFCFSGYNYTKFSVGLTYLIYIIFCIWVFKGLKIRFLAYPFIILNIFFGLYFYEVSGLGTSNAVGVGYIAMYFFMFITLPLMVVALVVGGIFDVIEFLNKNKSKQEDICNSDE
ncbi:MAG: hypothetical protein K6A44_08010 [bacterium]|nr:hypothetical protein [bacterium]